MKKIILILAIHIALSCNAQNPEMSLTEHYQNRNHNEGVYIKDTQGLLTPYIGSWKWQNGSSSLTIVIEKLTMDYEATTTKQYRDKLVGRIKYIENGVEKMNTLTIINPNLRQKTGIPLNGTLYFSYKDPVIPSKFGGEVRMELVNNSQIKFKLTNTEGIRFTLPGEQPENPNFSMPKNVDFVLTKQ